MVEKDNEKKEYNPDLFQDLLPVYYKRLFPHENFYRWLSYGNTENSIFTNREISFTLMNDIYLRYLSFENASELKKEICSRNPFKIDIGPVMSVRPKDHRTVASIQPVQRELVFDIDMTDYDDVRTCCEGAEVCQKCWKFMSIACKILDAALREDFGFEHILWVFSGRRGIHCWVCDKIARHLDTKGRSAIAEYLQVVTHSGESGISKVLLGGEKIHHSVKRALKVIEPRFEEICLVDQNLFATPAGFSKLLQLVYDENIRRDLDTYLKNYEGNSKAIWEHFNRFFNNLKVHGNQHRKLKYISEEVQLALLYPRLDINVTKGFNHLLKAPFCVHPKTGKVCVPFNPNVAEKFDPTKVPTINKLLDEINAFDDQSKADDVPEDKGRIKDVKKTGMFKGTFVFEEFLRKLESTYKHKAIEVSDLKMEI